MKRVCNGNGRQWFEKRGVEVGLHHRCLFHGLFRASKYIVCQRIADCAINLQGAAHVNVNRDWNVRICMYDRRHTGCRSTRCSEKADGGARRPAIGS